MKKKLVAAVLAAALAMTGCAAAKGLETDTVKISNYKGVEITEIEKPSELTDEDVAYEIQLRLESNPKVTEIKDRPVEEGDTVDIDFVGKVDGKEFEGGSSEGYELIIGSGTFIEGFEDSIIGHEVGETFDWNGKFPKEYAEDLAGKDVVFTITINAIKQEEIPEFNDEFVEYMTGEKGTTEEYADRIRKELEEDAEYSYHLSVVSAAWEAVLANTEVLKWPEEVDATYEDLIGQYKQIAEYYQMDYNKFIEEQMGQTVEAFETSMREEVEHSFKENMVAEAIAKEENITLDDKTFEKELEAMAVEYGYADAEAVRNAAEEDELRKLALVRIVSEWVAESCVQVAK